MNVSLKWVWELDTSVEPAIYVIADVYAATTNLVTLLSKEVAKIVIVNERNVQEAKKIYPDSLAIGESTILPDTFFVSSNYPYALDKVDVKGKTVLYMSANGSRVIEQIFNRTPLEVLTVSFCNVSAVARYLQTTNQQNVVLVASGNRDFADQVAEEDILCLYALKKRLQENSAEITQELQTAETAVRTHYASHDMNKDIAIVFHSPQLPIIPICERQENEMILVKLPSDVTK